MRYRLSGIIASTPMRPPHMARAVIWRHAGFIPQMKRAGIVNRTPEATEELAEPMVCDMLASRMLCLKPTAWSSRKATTVSTATGMEVLMVKPALRPR